MMAVDTSKFEVIYKGIHTFYVDDGEVVEEHRVSIPIGEIEETCDIEDLVAEKIDAARCVCVMTESKSLCDCGSVYDYGDFEIERIKVWAGKREGGK